MEVLLVQKNQKELLIKRKLFCSYDIHDWITRWTWEEAKADYYNPDPTSPWNWQDDYPTIKEFYRNWMKNYKRK